MYPPIVRGLQLLGTFVVIRVFGDNPVAAFFSILLWWLGLEIAWDTRHNW